MASVRRFRQSQFWFGCYTGPDGLRKQRSTKQTDRQEAMSITLAWEKAARAAREGRFVQASTRRLLREIHAVSGNGMADSSEAGRWLADWVAKATRRLKPKSALKYQQTIEHFVTTLPAGGAGPLADITPAQVAEWRDGLVGAGLTEKTANIKLGILSQAMAEAVVQNLAEINPCKGLKFRKADAKSQQKHPFRLEQFNALVAATDGEWRTFILTLGLTGARQQEAAQLRWSQVDFKRGVVRLIRGKQNDREHVVPLHPRLHAALQAAFRQTSSVFVLPTIAAQEGKALSKHFRRVVLPKVGIVQPYGRTQKGQGARSREQGKSAGHQVSRYSLHSLRHSLATWLDESGAPAAVNRAVLGHASKAINEGYTHTEMERTRAAIARIGA